MNSTSISWVLGPDGQPGYTWNPFAGCSPNKPSKGCDYCYAERLAATRLAHLPAYRGLTTANVFSQDIDGKMERGCPTWTGTVRFFPEELAEPLRRRKPAGIFVGDMGDIGLLPFEQIAAIFGVIAACPQHRFYVLTKRPGRMREWFEWLLKAGGKSGCAQECVELAADVLPGAGRFSTAWPFPNVWLGTSVCTQADADKNIPELLQTPAAVRGLSMEPLLEEVDVIDSVGKAGLDQLGIHYAGKVTGLIGPPLIDWVIVGGESGPHARPCHVEWIRSIVRQCREAGVACFVKQLGANAIDTATTGLVGLAPELRLALRDRAGADIEEFPMDLRIREMPEVPR